MPIDCRMLAPVASRREVRTDTGGGEMSEDDLRTALAGLRVRIPRTAQDAVALRAEVRAADAALGRHLRAAAAQSQAGRDERRGGDAR